MVDVTQVIDLVRDDLAVYLATDPVQPASEGVCYKKAIGSQPMDLKPVNITVTLKAVSTREKDPTAGVKDPLGFLAFDPNYSGSYSNSRTQTITIPLAIPDVPDKSKLDKPAPGEHPVADALIKFRKGILGVNHNKLPCLKFTDDGKSNFTVSLAFDVVNVGTAGIGLQLVFIKIGEKEVNTNEAHQTLDIELALVGSKTTTLFKPEPTQ